MPNELSREKEYMSAYRWMKTDIPSIMFSCLSTKKWGRTFRIAVVLKEKTVDARILEKAIEDLRSRFPHFYSKLKKGFFWNYLEQTDGLPEIRPENNCQAEPIALCNNGPDFRIVYTQNSIAIEIAHYISDGHGALTFLLALTQRYLELAKNLPSEPRKGILYWQDAPSEKETDDDFLRYGDFDGEKIKSAIHDVYRLPAVYEKDYLHLHYLEMSVRQVQTEARAMQITMTEFMTAVYMLAVIRTAEKPIQNSVGVDIPVNLRSFFESATLRNFVYQVSVLLPVNGKQDWTLEKIADAIRGQVRSHLNKEELQAILKGLTGLAKNPVVRLVPNFLKTPVLRVLQARSHSDETTIITNLGKIDIADDIADCIERIEFVNGDTSGYGLPSTCSSAGFNDRFVFCISSNNHDDRIVSAMKQILNESGIALTEYINETNYNACKQNKEKATAKPFFAEKCKAYFHF